MGADELTRGAESGDAAAAAAAEQAASAEAGAGGGDDAEISSVSDLAAALADEGTEVGGSEPEAKPTPETSGDEDDEGEDADGKPAGEQEQPGNKPPETDDAKAKADAEAEEKRLNDEAAEKHPAFQKRIDQLVAQRNEARQAAETQQQELDAAKQQLAVATQRVQELERGGMQQQAQAAGVSQLYLAQNQQELETQRQQLMGLVQWCRQNRDGGMIGNQELDADAVEAALQHAENELMVHLPDAQKTLVARTQAEGFAKQAYPGYFGDEAQGRGQNVMRGLLQKVPGLARVEQLPVIVGDMLAGAQLRKMGLVPAADGKSLVGKDGKPAWTTDTAKSTSAKAIVAEALREQQAAQGGSSGAAAGTVGGAATGAPKAPGRGSREIRSEEDLAAELAG